MAAFFLFSEIIHLHFYKYRYNNVMDILSIIKALSNESRYSILQYLKQPEKHFPLQIHLQDEDDFAGGVCVGAIAEKAGLAQSVVSGYLAKLQQAGLLECRRIGQWTYYRRNEAGIQSFIEHFKDEL